jgi:hypothetical protein
MLGLRIAGFRAGALVFTVALAACSPPSSSGSASADCVEPSNPWDGDGGGHEAGFKWAQETRGECPTDHGDSFEEGCNEFYNQHNRYEACVAAKR